MLVNFFIKIILIIFTLTFFLTFKNMAKKIETNITHIDKNINIASQEFEKKRLDLAIKLQSELNLKNKNYLKTDGILIENYMNQEMTIIRVNYDKKSY